ncbi:preprotein translocase subunit SecY [Candidatus Bipolaricaulota bacterium]|nr:preprotein translocase subunit SecY [Candidatus Bipolaricaulota bacterium]
MWEKVAHLWRIPELRKRILFTLGAIVIVRLGALITVPGIDSEILKDFWENQGAGVFGFFDMFSGGALSNFSLFALGVTPYINASIIFSLLTSVVPKLKELQRQGREGRRKITAYTRWATVVLALLQGMVMSYWMRSAVVGSGLWFYVSTIIILVTGTIFLMWLGERMTENGIGNGISMIIMVGILARFPTQISRTALQISTGGASIIWGLALIALFIVVIAGVIIVQQGQRKIQIQYAKRTSGRRVYGGHSSHLPIRVNQGGVIPIIFASALLTLPVTLISAIDSAQWLVPYVTQGSLAYVISYVLLIFFFTFFYSSIVFEPTEVAKNIRDSGGFIPGVRPGRPTSEYISSVLNRVLMIGAVFLACVAALPYVFSALSGLTAAFLVGGTSLLIVVGVGMDTIMQIEAHLVMRHYESLAKSGGLLGRRG